MYFTPSLQLKNECVRDSKLPIDALCGVDWVFLAVHTIQNSARLRMNAL